MTKKPLAVAHAALLFFAAGCVASKSDIRLLQDELRATRQQLALGDTSILRADDARRNQINQLSVKLDRAIDSLRVVANRLATLSANANGSFEQIQQQVSQLQALVNQNTRNVQEARSQMQMLTERRWNGAADGGSHGAGRRGSGGGAWRRDAVQQRARVDQPGRVRYGTPVARTAVEHVPER